MRLIPFYEAPEGAASVVVEGVGGQDGNLEVLLLRALRVNCFDGYRMADAYVEVIGEPVAGEGKL